MNENTKTTPNALTESYPAQRVSDDLRLRVKRLAAQHDDKASLRARSQRKRRLILSYGGAVAAVGAGLFLQPKFAAAAVLGRIEHALDGVRTFHEVAWEQGRSTERWWKVGEVSRTETPSSTVVIRDGKHYQWLRESNKVIVQPAKPRNSPLSRSGFTITSLIHDLRRSGWTGSLEALSDTTESGKTFQRFQVTMKSWEGAMRVVLVVDPATQLPKRYEGFVQRDGNWEPFNRIELEYNQPESPTLFSGEFPGARVLDLEKEKVLWQEKLEHAIAEVKLGERTIQVRDIRVNPQGAIFVLYTAGKTFKDYVWKPSGAWGTAELPRDWQLQLVGGDYKCEDIYNRQLLTKEWSRKNLGAQPVLRSGEVLQGTWFIPTAPRPSAPKSVTVRFAAAPTNLHGPALEHEGRRVMLAQETLLPDYRQASVTLTPTPQSDFVPDYWPTLVKMPLSDDFAGKELRQRFESVRSTELMCHRATLPQALEAIQTEEALTSAPDHNFLIKKTQVLGLLGRRAEAEKTLQQALVAHSDQSRHFPKQYENDYFFWEQVCTAWYAIGDEAKAVEAREKALVLARPSFPGRVTWHQEHPNDLRPKLD